MSYRVYGDILCTVLGQLVRSVGRLTANSTYVFLCDMQEKFRPTIKYYPEIITVAQKMVWVVCVYFAGLPPHQH